MSKEKDSVTIEYFDRKLQSVNHLYGRNPYGAVYLKPEGLRIKQDIRYMYSRERLKREKELGYELTVYGNWYNKPNAKTRIKRRDSNNLLKLIIDACCDAIDVDDKQFFKEEIRKVQNEEKEGFKMRIYYLKN